MTLSLKTSLRTLISLLWLLTSQWAVATEWIELLDGKSLKGWTITPTDTVKDHWRVEEGLLVAENSNKQGSVLWTKCTYRDYEIEVEYRTPSSYYDSGVFLRGKHHQVQIGISSKLKIDLTGCIYAPRDGRGRYPAKTDKVAKVHRVGEWNRLRIVVVGDRISTFLNGVPFVDYKAAKLARSGPCGLQLHARHHMKLYFRQVRIRELAKASKEVPADTTTMNLGQKRRIQLQAENLNSNQSD